MSRLSLAIPCQNLSGWTGSAECGQRSKMQPESAKCSLNYAHKQSLHQVVSWCRCPSQPLQKAALRRVLGGWESPLALPSSPLRRPGRNGCRWRRTSPSQGASGGGSMLRRNLSSLGVETPLAPFKPNNSLYCSVSSTCKSP